MHRCPSWASLVVGVALSVGTTVHAAEPEQTPTVEADGPGTPQVEPTAKPAPPDQTAPVAPPSSQPSTPRAAPTSRPRPIQTPEARLIRVSTDGLQDGTPLDAYRHPGGRTIIDTDLTGREGAASFTDALQRVPGLRADQGNAGLGSVGTKLNVGSRGVNSRFSSRTTVLLDEVPIAAAPYGRPQLTLFPISPFSISRIDVARGGASLRYGPQTAGGVTNLVSRPVPERLTVLGASQIDQWGATQHGVAVGGTGRGGRVGAYLEATPRYGRDWRDHSHFHTEGGMLKLRIRPSHRVTLRSTSHAYWESVEIPGGLRPSDSARDPQQSTRNRDGFTGWRVGTSAKLDVRPAPRHALHLLSYAYHTDRMSTIADAHDDEATMLRYQPRTFSVVALEPRYALRIDRGRGPFHDLGFGLRGAYERGVLRGHREGLPTVLADPSIDRIDADARADLGAIAAFVEEKLYLLDASLVLSAGLRMEHVGFVLDDRLDMGRGHRRYWAPLPAASIWWEPVSAVALFAAYARSFGPPQFLQITLANGPDDLQPEVADSAEAGLKLFGRGGVQASATGWFKAFDDLTDVSLEDFDKPGDTQAFGAELQAQWQPGEIWPVVEGLRLESGYAFTEGQIVTGPLASRTLPWYPRHEGWASLSHTTAGGLMLGTSVHHVGERFSDYANTVVADASGEVGLLPRYTLVHAHVGLRTVMPSRAELALTVGVRNLFDQSWYLRSDDRNGGILPMNPRTLYANLAVRHEPLSPRLRRRRR